MLGVTGPVAAVALDSARGRVSTGFWTGLDAKNRPLLYSEGHTAGDRGPRDAPDAPAPAIKAVAPRALVSIHKASRRSRTKPRTAFAPLISTKGRWPTRAAHDKSAAATPGETTARPDGGHPPKNRTRSTERRSAPFYCVSSVKGPASIRSTTTVRRASRAARSSGCTRGRIVHYESSRTS